MPGSAVVLAVGGAQAAVYGLAIVATIAQTLYRPAHSALLPAAVHVAAAADVNVLARNAFLTAVTGYPASTIAGERIVTAPGSARRACGTVQP